MRISSIATAAFALGFAAALAISQAVSQTGGASAPPVAGNNAAPEPELRTITGDRRLDAVVFGLASVSVDAEAAIIRINSLEDRLYAMEKRLYELEAKVQR